MHLPILPHYLPKCHCISTKFQIGTKIYFFCNGDFLKVLATKHAIFKFLWIIVKGSNQNSKVESRCRDSWRRLSTFFLLPDKGNTKKLKVVAVTHGDNLKKIFLPHNQKKCKICCLEFRRQPLILLAWSLPLQLIQNLNIAGFLATTLGKSPFKKLDYSTLNPPGFGAGVFF